MSASGNVRDSRPRAIRTESWDALTERLIRERDAAREEVRCLQRRLGTLAGPKGRVNHETADFDGTVE